MNRAEQIEEAIVAEFGDPFEIESIRADLHVTVHIAMDFYNFLVQHGESPNGKQIDYMAGTIRASIEEFYLLAYTCRRIVRKGEMKGLEPHEHWNFSALRERFMKGFEHLEDPQMSAVDRLTSLFALTHLELVFLAQNFPSAIFADGPGDSMTTNEILQAIKKKIGGKASWTRDAG